MGRTWNYKPIFSTTYSRHSEGRRGHQQMSDRPLSILQSLGSAFLQKLIQMHLGIDILTDKFFYAIDFE